MNNKDNALTELLNRLGGNDHSLVEMVYPLVYDHLKKEAHYQLRRERAGHTLQTTALVHEAYIKLVDQNGATFHNRAHFIAIAALAMRRILISHARKKSADKRGGHAPAVTFTDGMTPYEARLSELIDLDDVLVRLEALDERQARIVQYRFFGGMSYEEIADVLGGTDNSVRHEWRLARAWLKREMSR